MPDPISLELVFTSEVVAELVGNATGVARRSISATEHVIGLDLGPGEGVDVKTPLGLFGFFISADRKGAILAKVPLAIAMVLPPFQHHRHFSETKPLRRVYEIDVSPGIPASIDALVLGRISVRLR